MYPATPLVRHAVREAMDLVAASRLPSDCVPVHRLWRRGYPNKAVAAEMMEALATTLWRPMSRTRWSSGSTTVTTSKGPKRPPSCSWCTYSRRSGCGPPSREIAPASFRLREANIAPTRHTRCCANSMRVAQNWSTRLVEARPALLTTRRMSSPRSPAVGRAASTARGLRGGTPPTDRSERIVGVSANAIGVPQLDLPGPEVPPRRRLGRH